jgi:hypothetical protein
VHRLVFPRCSLLTYRSEYARRSRLKKQPTDLRRHHYSIRDGTLGLVFAFNGGQNVLSKSFGDAWNASFPLGLSQLFRLHLVPRLVLKSRLEFVRQQPAGQKPVQGLTRLAAATNSNAGGSMAEVYPVPLEKAFLEVLLRTLKSRESAPQRPRFLVRNRKSRHTPVYTESRLGIQIIDPRPQSEYRRFARGLSRRKSANAAICHLLLVKPSILAMILPFVFVVIAG